MHSMKLLGFLSLYLVVSSSTALAAHTCSFTVIDSETHQGIAGLTFELAEPSNEGESASSADFVEAPEFVVTEKGKGRYTVALSEGESWVLRDLSEDYCVNGIEITPESCNEQQVTAIAGNCTISLLPIYTAPMKPGDKTTGTTSFQRGVINKQKAQGVKDFLGKDLGFGANFIAALCQGTCANGETCTPTALNDEPGDGCDLRPVDDGNGGTIYQIENVSQQYTNCKITAMSCGCYTLQ